VSSSGCSASGSPLECTLTGLSNGVGYRFTVQAITATGLGAASPMVPAAGQAAIVSAVRPNAVDHLIAVRGNTTLNAQWTPLTTAQLGGGAFTEYRVSIALASGGGSLRDDTLGAQSDDSYTFTGLTNGVPYVITVVALTTANATPLTGNTAIVSEVPARAPDAVTGTYSATSGTTGVVSWPAPVSDGGSPVTSYTVTMTGTGGPFTCSATPPAMNCAVTGLTRGAAYSIEVSVHNAVGASTDPPVPVTQPNVPAAPVIMTVAPMTVDDSTWFEVTWSVPASNGAPITGYVVTATKRSAMGGMFVRAASADDTQFTCTSSTTECVMLAPGSVRDYAFVVVADNLAGVSAPSAPFVVPDPTPPGPGPVPPVPPAPTPPGPQPAPGPVPPGTTVVEVNGRPDPTASSGPVPTRDAIAITGSNYAMQIEALAADGKPVSLNDDTALVAYVGQRIEVSGTGMRPGTFAAAYVLDPVLAAGARSLARPVQVGTVFVATAESFTGAWRLPSVVQPGEYFLQVVGTLADGSMITVNTGMVVRHPDRRAIVITGQRGAGSTRHVITVQGRTLDFNREAIKPRIRLSGESKYSSGRPVIAQVGEFTWAREVAPRKKAYIYFSSGGIRSNRIIIDKAAPR
jgi:hypothetical protein